MVLKDGGVSRRHVRISERLGRFFAQDLGSSNGTQVNDEALTDEQELRTGDRISLGDVEFVFKEVVSDADSTRPIRRNIKPAARVTDQDEMLAPDEMQRPGGAAPAPRPPCVDALRGSRLGARASCVDALRGSRLGARASCVDALRGYRRGARASCFVALRHSRLGRSRASCFVALRHSRLGRSRAGGRGTSSGNRRREACRGARVPGSGPDRLPGRAG